MAFDAAGQLSPKQKRSHAGNEERYVSKGESFLFLNSACEEHGAHLRICRLDETRLTAATDARLGGWARTDCLGRTGGDWMTGEG